MKRPMQLKIYRGTKSVNNNADHDDLVSQLRTMIRSGQLQPLLVVWPNGPRLQAILNDSMFMLSVAMDSKRLYTSKGAPYLEGAVEVDGIRSRLRVSASNFVEPDDAMRCMQDFCNGMFSSDHVDFKAGVPDADLLVFPHPLPASKDRQLLRRLDDEQMAVTDALVSDMREVCEFLDELEDDPDVNIDFDDAIQIGTLCGGRIDPMSEQFLFTFYRSLDEHWNFKIDRGRMRDVAEGREKELQVSIWVYAEA